MARIVPWFLLLAGVCGALGRHHGSREEPAGVHHHHNYYGAVHNHIGNAGYRDDGGDHRDDRHEPEYGDDHHDRRDDHHGDSHHEEEHHDEDERIYRFRIDDDFPGYSYKNDKGQTEGFIPEFLLKLCKRAHKKCTYLTDVFTNCWANEGGGRPGWGLLDNWYDGCIGVTPTVSRKNSFNFTVPFSEPVHWRLYFSKEHEGNLDGVKVGFVDGFSLNPDTLHEHVEGDFTPVIKTSFEDLLHALAEGEIDAITNTCSEQFATDHDLVEYGDPFTIYNEGIAVMAHYGSDVINWWNEAFLQAVDNGDWAKFCRYQKALHGDDITCNHLEH